MAHYSLGLTIISDKEGKKFIIDGQQRLTTLTLLLIFLCHHMVDDSGTPRNVIAGLIFSTEVRQKVIQS